MSPSMIVLIVLLIAIVLGIPVPFAVAISTVVGMYLIHLPFVFLAQNAYTGLQSMELMAIPLFILAGVLMQKGGLASRIIDIARALVGQYRGSMGVVTLLGCAFFGALSGSGPATTAALGTITVPAMQREGYRPALAGAIAASGGALGSLIPPSNLMIIYGIVSDNSIPRLFLAGVIPGVLALFALLVCLWTIARVTGLTHGGEAFSWRRVWIAAFNGKWALGAPIVILGGIYSGIFTPAEAAAVAVVYALVVGGLIYKELTFAKIVASLKAAALISGSVVIMLGVAKAFGQLASLMNLPDAIGHLLQGVTTNPFTMLMIISAILLITGMFIDTVAQIILLTPLLLPIATSLGVDPIVFGIIMVINCEIGFLTPPVGANLFVASRITRVGIEGIGLNAIPFLFAYLVVIVLISLAPSIVTVLPNMLYGRVG